ncbi:MAG: hypothetical protein ABFS86_18590, partial [Planctomycetota bacterium]
MNTDSIRVLVDPSILLRPSCVERVWELAEKVDLYVPASFVRMEDFPNDLVRFYGGDARQHGLPVQMPGRPFSVSDEFRLKHGEMGEQLARQQRSPLVAETLLEEWVFLNECSWIVSHTKKVFTSFIRAGAA